VAESRFGNSIATGKIVASEDYEEAIIGAPGMDASSGAAYLIRTNPDSSGNLNPICTLAPGGGGAFGESVTVLGDLDRDGLDDFAVSAPLMDPGGIENAGQVFLYKYNTIVSPKTCTLLATLSGDEANLRLGLQLANAGDLNADGLAELIVSGNRTVRVYQYQPTESSFREIYRVATSSENASISTLSDINVDGRADFIVGDPDALSTDPAAPTAKAGRVMLFVSEAPVAVPAPPINVQARALADQAGTLIVEWTDRASNESGFTVEYARGNSPDRPVITVAANVTTATISGLAAASTYRVRVRANHASGDSVWTRELWATTR